MSSSPHPESLETARELVTVRRLDTPVNSLAQVLLGHTVIDFAPVEFAEIYAAEVRQIIALALDAALQRGEKKGLGRAADVALDGRNLDMVGGSTGNAYGTALRIEAAIRALMEAE